MYLVEVILEEEAMVELDLALCTHDDGHQSLVCRTVVLPPQLIVTLVAMEILTLGCVASPLEKNGLYIVGPLQPLPKEVWLQQSIPKK
jgi:hypothetical protein